MFISIFYVDYLLSVQIGIVNNENFFFSALCMQNYSDILLFLIFILKDKIRQKETNIEKQN